VGTLVASPEPVCEALGPRSKRSSKIRNFSIYLRKRMIFQMYF